MFRSKSLLAGLATTAAALSVAVGSGATFNSQTANPTNTFSSGTFTHSNSKNGVAIVTGANMKPGDVKVGEVTITNTGSIAGIFKLAESNAANGFTAGNLKLKIEDITTAASPVVIYSGDVGGVAAGGLDLGAYAAGAARTYRFTTTLDAATTNADQGKSATADYTFSAVQQ